MIPSPTVKKNFLSIFLGTFAGNFWLAKLRIFLLKFAANEVSLKIGNDGLDSGNLILLWVGDGW